MPKEISCEEHKKNYEEGKYPKCYKPCPPFYDFCNHAFNINDDLKCSECLKEFGFKDYIE